MDESANDVTNRRTVLKGGAAVAAMLTPAAAMAQKTGDIDAIRKAVVAGHSPSSSLTTTTVGPPLPRSDPSGDGPPVTVTRTRASPARSSAASTASAPSRSIDSGGGTMPRPVNEVASRRIVPFVIGGDHTITWPSATAVADVYGYGNVGMVHFDAHADTADTCDGNLASHGTPMRRLIESGAIPGKNFVQIGLRSYWPPQDTWDWMAQQGMRWHLMDEIWERGFKPVMADAVGEALAKAEKLYISVDIDVLDPAFAPGTGTPEPGGIPSSDLLRMVRDPELRARRGAAARTRFLDRFEATGWAGRLADVYRSALGHTGAPAPAELDTPEPLHAGQV